MAPSPSSFETVSVRAPQRPNHDKAMVVTSQSLSEGETIDRAFVYTGCGGRNQSPQLSWSGAPAGTKSFAITCFDPDAPTGCGYWHWLACDIPASIKSIDSMSGENSSPAGARCGFNDFSVSSYCGPCPPKGDRPHRYIYTVYALDVASLGIDEATTGATFIFRMRGHVLATGSISGTFGH